jgi:tetratricopeptide (TPR) repeat protein
MRARLGLAVTLWGLGRRDEAIEHYREMIRLNPGDNQGVRYLLVGPLLEMGRDEEVGVLLSEYPDHAGATLVYAGVLWEFRRNGDAADARKALAQALRVNPHVPEVLLDSSASEFLAPGSFALGSEEEALEAAVEIGRAWETTPGALDWLRQRAGRSSRPHRGTAPRRRRKR